VNRAALCLCALAALAALAPPLGAQAPHTQQNPIATDGRPTVKTHDDLQPATLPALPPEITLGDIVRGDSIYHGKGTCFVCHGVEGEGRPAAGDALTVGLNWAQPNWRSIDSLIDKGIPQPLTRSPIQMPPRGGRSDLTDTEVGAVAAYVWAISQARGEPWPGGHGSHQGMTPAGADAGTATTMASERRLPTTGRRPADRRRGRP
jgi:mono/diheme cytochrome c family protein